MKDANVRVISIGLKSDQFTPKTLKTLARRTNGSYIEADNPAALEQIYKEIGQQLSSEYELTYRSLLPPQQKAVVLVKVAGLAPATAKYTTPALDLTPQGTFETTWIDDVITSPWLMIFVIVAVLALVCFAILSAVDVRNRSLRRRMAQYVTVPSEDESRMRRAEVSAMLADTAQRTVGGQRWWQRFETDVELGGFNLSPLAIAGWTIVGGIVASIAGAIIFQALWGLLIGLAAPFVTRWYRLAPGLEDAEGVRGAARRQPRRARWRHAHRSLDHGRSQRDGRQRDRAIEDRVSPRAPGRAARRPARRRSDGDGPPYASQDAEQIALVMRLQREAGGNTAEVLDRVAEVIRGRMELRRLVEVLTAQARISRWILTSLPIFVLLALIFTGGDYLQPMLDSLVGKIALVVGGIMVIIGSFWIKKISELDV